MTVSSLSQTFRTFATPQVLGLALALIVLPAVAGCPGLWPVTPPTGDETVQVRLINDSATQYVAPNLGVCPNGMANQPHHFVETPPVLAPGEEITYSAGELAGSGGNCVTFATDFMVGLCGWLYGADGEELDSVERRFGGQIGFQFSCGDTIILRWSEAGEDESGTWTSEVEPAAGNDPPEVPFQELE